MLPEPFEDSRRLTGSNLYFPGAGAALETARGLVFDETTLALWKHKVETARVALGWPQGLLVQRHHASGVSLAFTAPPDQLYTATEVNEWAWWSAIAAFHPGDKVPEGRMSDGEAEASDPASFSLREKVAEGRMREGASDASATPRKKLPLDQDSKNFIQQLRKNSTEPEQLIWSFLRDRRLHDQKFRRQKQLGPYVLDFYCHELKLAVELDGGQHNEAAHQLHDAKRDAYVASQGVVTLRYWNHEVLQNTETVLEDIWNQVHSRVSEAIEVGNSIPSSALRAPSPGGRRETNPSVLAAGLTEANDAATSTPSPALLALLPPETKETTEPFHAPGFAAVWDEDSALHTLGLVAQAEARPDLLTLMQATAAHHLPFLADDDEVTLGEGTGSRSWFIDELPTPAQVPWLQLHAIPTVLVTGSNGKTTTVRLLAAMTRAHGWLTAHSCTDGVFFDGMALEAGDFSGPTGARTALRQNSAQAAILETARGGMLRRGLAVSHANAAIVTNIAVDHFGEYGIHDLEDLARVKLVVAQAIDAQGQLTLNADDPVLVRLAPEMSCPLAWFALDFDLPLLQAQRQRDAATCGVREGRLLLHRLGATHDLGAVADMPLTMQARATYNVANIAGAALTAAALGITPHTIAAALARFGQSQTDNPGRLQHWRFGTTQVFVDYAHNPDGLRGLLRAVGAETRKQRLAIILGHAGNREDADLRAVASTAAGAHPELVVLKDIAGYERGRAAGEVAAIMRAQLQHDGVALDAIHTCLEEVDAARIPLAWAQEGDLLVLPIHEMEAREQVTTLLDQMAAEGWLAGQPLPGRRL